MKIFNLRNLVCLAAFFVLFACGDSNSNPFVGKWEAQMGDQKMTATFEATDATFDFGGEQQQGKVEYKKISDKVWEMTSTDPGGQAEKKEFEFQDNDHLVMLEASEMVFSRVKQ
jgi:hypothetical protein